MKQLAGWIDGGRGRESRRQRERDKQQHSWKAYRRNSTRVNCNDVGGNRVR